MKTRIIISALSIFAGMLQSHAQDRLARIGAFIGGNSVGKNEAERETKLMDGLSGGKRIPRTARLNDDLTVTITGEEPIPWEKVPAAIRVKLQPAYNRLSAQNAERAAGITTAYGKVTGRTPTGFLVAWRDETIHVAGKTNLTDGETFSGKVRRAGIYQYETVLGAGATVKNFVPVP